MRPVPIIITNTTTTNAELLKNSPSVIYSAVSVGEKLPEDGLVRMKHVAIKCDFKGILK